MCCLFEVFSLYINIDIYCYKIPTENFLCCIPNSLVCIFFFKFPFDFFFDLFVVQECVV